LDKSIKYRNDLIAEVHKESPVQADLLMERYFGLRNANGVTDERIKASVEAIYNQTDDCIFFSRILADDLLTCGNRLRQKNAWKYRFGGPKVEGRGLVHGGKSGIASRQRGLRFMAWRLSSAADKMAKTRCKDAAGNSALNVRRSRHYPKMPVMHAYIPARFIHQKLWMEPRPSRPAQAAQCYQAWLCKHCQRG
jgi:hypothetical protein